MRKSVAKRLSQTDSMMMLSINGWLNVLHFIRFHWKSLELILSTSDYLKLEVWHKISKTFRV